jgi:glutathione S-transferase
VQLLLRRQEFLGHWKTLTKEMDPDGPFFLGKEPSMIDFVVAPWAMRLWVFDYYKGGLGIPEEGKGGEDEAVWTRFRKWLKALEERPSIKNTTSEHEHYLPLWQRYADDEAQSEMAKATRKGYGVP